jgi:hypothetical protein
VIRFDQVRRSGHSAPSRHDEPISHAPQPCKTLRTTEVFAAVKKISSRERRLLALVALFTAAGGMLASCNAPVGVSPALRGTYRENSLVTNPDGNGPQVVRWGPPENYAPPGEGGGSGR